MKVYSRTLSEKVHVKSALLELKDILSAFLSVLKVLVESLDKSTKEAYFVLFLTKYRLKFY